MEGKPNFYSREAYTNTQREALREEAFPRILAQHLIEHVFEDFSDAGFEEDEIKDMEKTFTSLPEEQKRAFLSVPAQLRVKLYEKYVERVHSGELTTTDVLRDVCEKNERNNFSLGYHLSPREIKPDVEGNWVIKGTEPDHRNEDIPMAYYSLDYRSRYRDKPSKFLYVVRAELRDQSGHYRDNDGAWGRAPSLSIIDSFDLPELEKEMDVLIKESEQEKKTRIEIPIEKGGTPKHPPYESLAA